jgi:hypothetical protein
MRSRTRWPDQDEVTVARRTPEQRRIPRERLRAVLGRRRSDVRLARADREEEARDADSRVAPGAAGGAQHGRRRLLVQNNEAEAETADPRAGIYDDVQRQVYWFLAATLGAIVATSAYLIRSNRRLFAELASLSEAGATSRRS